MANEEEQKITTLKEIVFKAILFVIIFLLWEMFVVRPFRKRIETNSQNKREIVDFSQQNKQEDMEEENKKPKQIVSLKNDYLEIDFDTEGLLLNNVKLKKYTKSVEAKNLVHLLLDEKNNQYYINHSWISADVGDLPNSKTNWNFDEKAYKNDNSKLVFTYKNKENITFKNTFYLDDKYILILQQEIINNGKKNITIKPIIEINKSDIINRDDMGVFNGAIGVFTKDRVEEIKSKKLNKRNIEFNSFKWGGFTNKYWLVALINNKSNNGKVNFLRKDNLLKMQYITQNDFNIKQNKSIEHTIKIFLGVKDTNILDEYEKKENLKLFSRSIDYGTLFLITKPLSIFFEFNK